VRHQITAAELAVDPLDAAPLLLGCVLEVTTGDGTVGVRLTEVEAYRGLDDPASHCYRGRTARNAVMFGPAGHLYVYFVYGMHFCANVVCLTDGVPGAVLLRAGEVVSGHDLARTRRPASRADADLAKGPARLTSALGLVRADNGVDLTDPGSPVRLYTGKRVPARDIRTGPRVGVAAAAELPWRFWIAGAPSVSPYRLGGKRRPGDHSKSTSRAKRQSASERAHP
jgi:DNA-3-methyladenine glycosylase